MLRCVLYNADGQKICPPPLLSLTVETDEGVPADALYAVFPYTECGELARIRVYMDETLVFVGIIDEQEHVESASGRYMKLSARSLAAHLLDNEAAPCGYDHPSAKLIYERYVRQFGIRLSEKNDAVYFGEQNIVKGDSCWSVLKSFCIGCYSSAPRVSADGVLYMKGLPHEKSVCFGSAPGEVRYTRFSECVKRCEEISDIYVKTSNAGGYTFPIENADALYRGIRRRRYLNAVLTESPMRCADAMISNGRVKAMIYKLRCPSCLLGREGELVRISDRETVDGLYISALRYHMNADGEYTDVTLKRRTS